ncbi:MAG: DinB family protein [Acidimicrobiia bacterium]
MRQWNLPLFRSFSGDELDQPVSHPERGTISIRWMVELLAGHDIHHLRQLEAIASLSP